MLTAPAFSPVRRPSSERLKQLSSSSLSPVSAADEPVRASPPSNMRKRTARRHPAAASSVLSILSSSTAGSQSDDYDSEAAISPNYRKTSWRDDLDQWLDKEDRDRSPPPVLGHEGMPNEERKQAINNALKWLREEMVSDRR